MSKHSPQYDIQLLDKRRHNREAFDCGVPQQTLFLRTQAVNHARGQGNVGVTFVLVDLTAGLDMRGLLTIIGFYTLSSFAVEVGQAPLSVQARKGLPHFPRIPCTLLGQLGVDLRFRGQGFGENLVIDAALRAIEAARTVASYALVVEANSPEAAAFYDHLGFLPCIGHPTRFFRPLAEFELR